MSMTLKSLQRGALLMAAVVLVLIIVALVTAMSFLSVSDEGASGGNMSSAQALFAANSGLQRALFQYNKICGTACASLTNTNLAVGDGTSSTSPGTFTTSGTLYPSGVIASTLTGSGITATAYIIPVSSITNFAPHGRLIIQSEQIDYSATSTSNTVCGTQPCFVAWRRGANGTTAAAHASATAVTQNNQCVIRSTGMAGGAKRIVESTIQ
jgi:hypothetical protein